MTIDNVERLNRRNPFFQGSDDDTPNPHWDPADWCPNCDIRLRQGSGTTVSSLHACPLCGYDPNPPKAA